MYFHIFGSCLNFVFSPKMKQGRIDVKTFFTIVFSIVNCYRKLIHFSTNRNIGSSAFRMQHENEIAALAAVIV